MIKTSDGVEWNETDNKLVGSVKKVRSMGINNPPQVGEFPVFVEQQGSYRLFTYNRKLIEI